MQSDAAVFSFDAVNVQVLVHVDDMMVLGVVEHTSELLRRLQERLKMKVEKPIEEVGDETVMRGRKSSGALEAFD